MRTPLRTAVLLLTAAALAACSDSTGNEQRVPARVDVVSGNAQSGPVGTELPQPLVVKVVDANGKAVKNQLVNFRVVWGGGMVFGTAALTGSDGIARERWTLGTVAADSQKVEARAVDNATGAPIVFATFRATATPGSPASVAAVGGGARAGRVGGLVADSPGVKVSDQYGNDVPGVTVAWTADAGGTVAPASSQTNTEGIARTGWTLALRVDTTYRSTGATSAGNAVFTATTPSIPTTAVLDKASGDNQAVPAGTAPLPLTARLRLADGRPVQGAVVDFLGLLSKTDAAGQVVRTPSTTTTAGTGTYTATVTGGPSATFTVRVVPATPGTLSFTGFVGSGYTACTGSVTSETTVRLADAYGNNIAGATVNYFVTGGGGTVSATQALTNANGLASITWSLGPIAGNNTLNVSSGVASNQLNQQIATGPAAVAFAAVTPDTVHMATGATAVITGGNATDACGNVIPAGSRLGTGWSFSYGQTTPSTYFTILITPPNINPTVKGVAAGSGWVIGTFHHLGVSVSDSTFVIVQ